MLVFQTPPEALDGYVVCGSSSSIHAEPDVLTKHHGSKLFTCKLRALIRVDDLWLAIALYTALNRFDAKSW